MATTNKTFITAYQKEYNDEEKSVIAWANRSDQIDRSQDLIEDSAWDLKNFEANPVIPAFHMYNRPPIGRALWTKVVPGQGLRFKIKFSDTAEGQEFYDLYKSQIMNAFSVGFIPKSVKFREDFDEGDIKRYMRDGKLPSCVYTDVELLEISAVVVPDHMGALVERSNNGEIKSKGVQEFVEIVKQTPEYIEIEKEVQAGETKEPDEVEIDSQDEPQDEFQYGEVQNKETDSETEDNQEQVEETEVALDDETSDELSKEYTEDTEEKELDFDKESLFDEEGKFKRVKDFPNGSFEFIKNINFDEDENVKSVILTDDSVVREKGKMELSVKLDASQMKEIFDVISQLKEEIQELKNKETVNDDVQKDVIVQDDVQKDVQEGVQTLGDLEIDEEQLGLLIKEAVQEVTKSVTKSAEIDLSQITVDALKKVKGEIF